VTCVVTRITARAVRSRRHVPGVSLVVDRPQPSRQGGARVGGEDLIGDVVDLVGDGHVGTDRGRVDGACSGCVDPPLACVPGQRSSGRSSR
jgi:hypothetical protein